MMQNFILEDRFRLKFIRGRIMSEVFIDPKVPALIDSFELPDNLSFGRTLAPVMIELNYEKGKWGELRLIPYGPLTMDPCCKVLHYGQEIFEGLKAYKTEDGRTNLFRPEQNARRFNHSARRMAMPEIPEELFISSIELITKYCKNIIPSEMGTSLYIRPFMFATQVALGIGPSDSFKYMVVASPSGSYFKGGTVKVLIERESSRAAPGGTGTAKCGGNYAAGLKSALKMQELGYHQSLWLDAKETKYVEEMSGMNFMAVINGELWTPALTDTILEGITRSSILELAKIHGYTVREEKIDINWLIEQIKSEKCTEAFACGTAAIITPIELLGEREGATYCLKEPNGKITNFLREELLKIQGGYTKAPENWVIQVD
jgi:branched-chain amino acid aminotransferase